MFGSLPLKACDCGSRAQQDDLWTVRDSPAHNSTAFSTIHGLVFHDALSHQQPPDQALPDAHTGPSTSSAALEPPARASEIPVAGSDEDSPWSADEDLGPLGAAFGAVDYIRGPVTAGPAEPDHAQPSVTQVSSSHEQLQGTAFMTLQHSAPADEAARPTQQGDDSQEALPGTLQTASQHVAGLTHQLPPQELPGQPTPVPQHAAVAATAVVAASADVGVEAEELPATTATGRAGQQDGSPEEGPPPHSSTPLYTCHLQGLGGSSLALPGREVAFGAGEQLCSAFNAVITIPLVPGIKAPVSEAQRTPAMCIETRSRPGYAAKTAELECLHCFVGYRG